MANILLCKPQPRVFLPTILTRAHFILFYLLSVMLTICMSVCAYIWCCKQLCCYCVLFIIIPVVNVNIVQNSRFILVDLGQVGQFSSGVTLAHSQFGKALESNSIPFPSPTPLPGITELELPYVIVAKEAFCLLKKCNVFIQEKPTYIYIYILYI